MAVLDGLVRLVGADGACMSPLVVTVTAFEADDVLPAASWAATVKV